MRDIAIKLSIFTGIGRLRLRCTGASSPLAFKSIEFIDVPAETFLSSKKDFLDMNELNLVFKKVNYEI
jgi:hypothetical protein